MPLLQATRHTLPKTAPLPQSVHPLLPVPASPRQQYPRSRADRASIPRRLPAPHFSHVPSQKLLLLYHCRRIKHAAAPRPGRARSHAQAAGNSLRLAPQSLSCATTLSNRRKHPQNVQSSVHFTE
ncbi:hypothetical protein FVE85_9302 [Porphyridium purpureum]|uniref:Uncharacterized protein n=1 Tax=Porphyridium purpureum TaxID=35688 RepID=A0A5J4YPZ3_PORPP|nr:hypothetical protein FVE85_9302 [Porphyridium purpureum]|eukprot:POR2951..scf222_8